VNTSFVLTVDTSRSPVSSTPASSMSGDSGFSVPTAHVVASRSPPSAISSTFAHSPSLGATSSMITSPASALNRSRFVNSPVLISKVTSPNSMYPPAFVPRMTACIAASSLSTVAPS